MFRIQLFSISVTANACMLTEAGDNFKILTTRLISFLGIIYFLV